MASKHAPFSYAISSIVFALTDNPVAPLEELLAKGSKCSWLRSRSQKLGFLRNSKRNRAMGYTLDIKIVLKAVRLVIPANTTIRGRY